MLCSWSTAFLKTEGYSDIMCSFGNCREILYENTPIVCDEYYQYVINKATGVIQLDLVVFTSRFHSGNLYSNKVYLYLTHPLEPIFHDEKPKVYPTRM